MAMDLTSLFDYPGTAHPAPAEGLVFLAQATPDEWAKLIDHTEARRFAAGDLVVREGSSAQELLHRHPRPARGPGRGRKAWRPSPHRR